MDKRQECIVLGRNLGTASGWDPADDWVLSFYDFIPREGIDLPAGDLVIDFNTGGLTIQTQDGDVIYNSDIAPLLNSIPAP